MATFGQCVTVELDSGYSVSTPVRGRSRRHKRDPEGEERRKRLHYHGPPCSLVNHKMSLVSVQLYTASAALCLVMSPLFKYSIIISLFSFTPKNFIVQISVTTLVFFRGARSG